MVKKLCRSRKNKVISGVCGGIGEYFSTDPTIVRLVWGAAIFLGGTGFLAYIVAMFIMPKCESDDYNQFSSANNEFDISSDKEFYKDFDKKFDNREFDDTGYKSHKPDKKLFGLILVALGAFFLARQYLSFISDKVMFPALLIIFGLIFIFKSGRRFL
ncbi:MAG: PspC domain-containing protein [Bacillota bacterium]|nr:PspC domain-containing protein [Bacillota bacterium]